MNKTDKVTIKTLPTSYLVKLGTINLREFDDLKSALIYAIETRNLNNRYNK